MRLPLVQVDAFAPALFSGNPAAVVRLGRQALPDRILQAIAAENNLSETAFVSSTESASTFGLRWFTPTLEVDLCGHATLAAGSVVLEEDGLAEVHFQTRSGMLHVRTTDHGFAMDLPRIPWREVPVDPAISAVLGDVPAQLFEVRQTHGARYYMARYAHADAIRALAPDILRMGRDFRMNIIVTAVGDTPGVDFVSRFFAPASGVSEDPVTGSAHCTLAPYWAGVLDRTELVGHQLSRRGGVVRCVVHDEHVTLAGPCARYLSGTLDLPETL